MIAICVLSVSYSFESYAGHACRRKDWKVVLKEWLNLLVRMCNAKSLYQSAVLKEVLIKRLVLSCNSLFCDQHIKLVLLQHNWFVDSPSLKNVCVHFS